MPAIQQLKNAFGFIAILVFSLSLAAWVLQLEHKVSSKIVEPVGQLLSKRQFTFEGKRSGEGYWANGELLVFLCQQSPTTRFTDLPMDLPWRNQSGLWHGKTTSAWIHPSKKKCLVCITHLDPVAKAAKAKIRESSQIISHSWDYDEITIFVAPRKENPKRLTRARAMMPRALLSEWH